MSYLFTSQIRRSFFNELLAQMEMGKILLIKENVNTDIH